MQNPGSHQDESRICVLGLGKLGAPMAAVLADAGYQVTGADRDAQTVERLRSGFAPVDEPDLQELIQAGGDRLSATTDTQRAVQHSAMTFVMVPTPSADDGSFRLDQVLEAAESIGRALRHKAAYHLVVISSTVMPGSTGGPILRTLEAVSGKKCGADFGLCYSPEFVALGTVIRDMRRPDFILIGEYDTRAGDRLEDVYRRMCPARPPVARMNFVNAEITKLALNTYVTTKISYANMLAEICERLEGADAATVTAALSLDSRISGKYLKSALGYGGPCFPRDNLALAHFARGLGVEATLAEATHRVNLRQLPRLSKLVRALAPDGGSVGILGLSYKPLTSVVEQSQGLALAQSLREAGIVVAVYDPAAMEAARAVLGAGVRYCASMRECSSLADVLVIATAWDEFRTLKVSDLNYSRGRPALIDCWRILPGEEFASSADCLFLGQWFGGVPHRRGEHLNRERAV